MKGILVDRVGLTYSGLAGSVTALEDITLSVERGSSSRSSGPRGAEKRP
jgi:hypothetical protein